MTPAQLASIHAVAFERPWDATAFASLLDQAGVMTLGDADGFILIRTVLDEAEILTLAVRPEARRKGYARALVEAAAAQASEAGAERLHLEVAEDNRAALALYLATGFVEVGRRPGYYARRESPDAAALLLARKLAD